MKSSEFLQSLRKIIREEVQTAVSSALQKHGIIQEQVVPSTYTESYKPPVPKAKKTPAKQFVKDPVLNQLLNETTAISSIDYNDYDEWPTMPMTNMIGSRNIQPQVVSDINGNTVPLNTLPDSVANALTKDYSQLMKAIDAKKSK